MRVLYAARMTKSERARYKADSIACNLLGEAMRGIAKECKAKWGVA